MIYTQIGLVLDIVGVIILFEYGLPSKVKDTDGYLLLGDETDSSNIKRKNKQVRFMAYLGLILILLGFIFQFISTIATK